MHNKLKKSNKHDLSCNIHIIKNCDVLMTIIMMLKFTQSPRPTKCVSIWYHCLMYHDMVIYQYIVASLIHFLGLAKKCDAGSQNIAFFLQNTPVSGMGLQTRVRLTTTYVHDDL